MPADGPRQPGLRRERARPRLRPGEAPCWIDDAIVDDAQAREWRHRAEDLGLGVDGWAALMLEFELVRREVEAAGSGAISGLIDEAYASARQERLGPTPALRNWIALFGQRGEAPRDELPALVLPERLLAQVRVGGLRELLAAATGREPADAAACELAAAYEGRTLEAWALKTALSLAG